MPQPAMPQSDDPDAWNAAMDAVIGQALPMRLEEVSKDRVVIGMEVTPRTHQPWGILHGGVSLVLAETAASIGANRNVAPGLVAVGQEINANHIRSKRDGWIRAVAVPLHVGRTSQVWAIEIRDEEQKLACVSRCTLAVIPRT
ncbi:MAG TPA: hotdog fold thioesterase [Dehalococcoidia bacterium]|nr:hotdog fold thioesterase [Dehalococcoidia bacterium]